MDDVNRGQHAIGQPATAADLLIAAREAHGLNLADIAARTRIPLRHLEAIEASNYAGLPSPTYAVGFAKAYARAVGADEVAVAGLVRGELAGLVRRVPDYQPYVTSDPARVPSAMLAMIGAGIAVAILILVALWYGTGWFRGGNSDEPVTVVADAPAAPVVRAVPAAAAGQVTLAATDTVWIRVYDADDKTLYLGTMKPGERYDVPADASDPMINVGRPDKLDVTLNGSAVPPLGSGDRAIKDVRVSAAAIAARGSAAPVQAAAMAPSTDRSALTTLPAARTVSHAAREPRHSSRSSRSRPRASAKPDGPENLLPSGFSTGAPNP